MPHAADSSRIARVLVIAPTPFFGDRGCHVRIFEEVRALAGLGVESAIATYAAGRDVPGLRIRRAPRLPGLEPTALGPSWSRPLLDATLTATSWRTARRFRPDVIHAHLHEGIPIGAIVRRLCGAPLVADLQGSLTAELVDHGFIPDGGVRAAAVERFERWLVKRPDLLLVSSAAGVSMLAGQGVDDSRIRSLPDGVDLDAFHPMPPDPELVARLGLDGRRVVVFLGVLTPYQGVDTLLDAVPLVLRDVPEAHFILAGYPNEQRYRALVSDRGLAGSVTLPGRIPYGDAARWLNLGHVAVSAKRSLTEANGKLLNYMACGLPVVATETAVNRELLGGEGLYVPVGDPGALAAGMTSLLRNESERRRRGDALRQRAVEQFAWPSLAGRLLDAYTTLRRLPAH